MPLSSFAAKERLGAENVKRNSCLTNFSLASFKQHNLSMQITLVEADNRYRSCLPRHKSIVDYENDLVMKLKSLYFRLFFIILLLASFVFQFSRLISSPTYIICV